MMSRARHKPAQKKAFNYIATEVLPRKVYYIRREKDAKVTELSQELNLSDVISHAMFTGPFTPFPLYFPDLEIPCYVLYNTISAYGPFSPRLSLYHPETVKLQCSHYHAAYSVRCRNNHIGHQSCRSHHMPYSHSRNNSRSANTLQGRLSRVTGISRTLFPRILGLGHDPMTVVPGESTTHHDRIGVVASSTIL